MYAQAILPRDFNPFAPVPHSGRKTPKPRDPARTAKGRKGRFLPAKQEARVALEALEVISWLAGPVAVAAVLLHG